MERALTSYFEDSPVIKIEMEQHLLLRHVLVLGWCCLRGIEIKEDMPKELQQNDKQLR